MWAIAINPTAGHGKGSVIGKKVIDFFSSNSLAYQVFSGSDAEELRSALEAFLNKEKCEAVISVGGDGLAHLILQLCVPRRVPFAVMPAGTGNDFVRTLGWSLDDVKDYLGQVVSVPPAPIDLGIVDSEWFAAILSTGFDSIVNERANSLTWPKGPQRYNVAIALELPKFKPIEYEITLDNQEIKTEAMLIAIGNGRSYGGGMYVCPQAQMHDGLFDIMVLEPVSKIEFLKVFPKVYSGSHISHPKVKMYRSHRVSLIADAVAYADGERIGPAPISAECVTDAGLTWAL
jgi:diacylglycerol kinase (ATP)